MNQGRRSDMGWIVSIVLAAGAIGWLYAQMRPNDMESVIRRLPEDERRKLHRDFGKIDRDEPIEGDRVGNDQDWRHVWFRVLQIEGCSRDDLGWWTLSAVVEQLDRTWGTRT